MVLLYLYEAVEHVRGRRGLDFCWDFQIFSRALYFWSNAWFLASSLDSTFFMVGFLIFFFFFFFF